MIIEVPGGVEEDMAASANNGNPGELRKEWVRLNVGGRVFTTSRATLTKDPQSFLARIALEDTELGSDKVINQIFQVQYIARTNMTDHSR